MGYEVLGYEILSALSLELTYGTSLQSNPIVNATYHIISYPGRMSRFVEYVEQRISILNRLTFNVWEEKEH